MFLTPTGYEQPMMGSEEQVGSNTNVISFSSMVPGTGLEPVTFGCLRHFEVYRAHYSFAGIL